MELVAVLAHVEDIEGAHCRPAVLVGEGQRYEPISLDLGGEGLEVRPRGRDRVALVGEQALPVDDDPRVVVHRDEVLLAVVAGGCLLEGVRVVAPGCGPDIGDVRRQSLGREESHSIAGEPGEHVVRRALKV